MSRSTGLLPRRGYSLDAETVIVGEVKAGTRGRAATTRSGAELLLNTRLEAQDVFKIVVHGDADAAGGYIIQAAHVPEGSTTPSTYATIATVTCAPGIQEIALSGAQVRELCRVAGSVTGDVRVTAIKAVAGTGEEDASGNIDGNGILIPAGVNTISVQYA